MKQLLKLTMFQLKDKVDFSWLKSRKSLIQSIVFGLLKFIVIGGIAFGLLFLLSFIGFINKYDVVLPTFTIFLTVIVVLNLFTVTYTLMRSLFFADDNKVLITFPVTANKLFFSKILVYFIFELKKSFGILIPAILGFLIFEIIGYKGVEVTFWSFIFMPIPVLILVILEVLIGAALSIPFLYIYQFYKKHPVMDLVTIIVVIIAGLLLAIKLISLIPDDIDLNEQWPSIVNGFKNFAIAFNRYAYPFNLYADTIFGEVAASGNIHYVLTGLTFIKTLISLGVVVVFGLIVFFLIKPFYFRMINKSFEFDKTPITAQKKNIGHKRYITFANKEFKLSFRDFDISGTYITIYIIVPLLLFFMDRVISAISTSLRGDNIAFAVNLLLTILPLLASNSTIATLYSKEGRSAYITKTNPVDPLLPLISKLLFNLLFSIPSIIACSIIFANFSGLGGGLALIFALSVLLLQYAHIFFCAAQDIMNPQNEAYATSGSNFNNPNETRATIVAFVFSFIISFVFYFFLQESYREYDGDYSAAFVRLFIASVILFAGFLYLFVMKIKAFYYDK